MINPDDSDRSEPAVPQSPLPRLYERDIGVLLCEELPFGRPIALVFIASLRDKATGKTAPTWVSHWWTFDGNRLVKVVEAFDGTKALMAMTPD